jgi:hypothetical protein
VYVDGEGCNVRDCGEVLDSFGHVITRCTADYAGGQVAVDSSGPFLGTITRLCAQPNTTGFYFPTQSSNGPQEVCRLAVPYGTTVKLTAQGLAANPPYLATELAAWRNECASAAGTTCDLGTPNPSSSNMIVSAGFRPVP